MSFARTLNATGLHHWAARSVAELSQRRAEINALNVFPVPDADTGSNMAHTMEAALAQADRGGDVAEALAIGSVRGARGNSGMVLSQVLRGVADATQDSVVDAAVLAESLNLAVALVDRAIADPVEGTIITVLRAAAAEAQLAHGDGEDLHEMLVRVVAAAREALEDTPSQLAVLREAGVVDAGGTGLVILLECLLAELEGADMAEAAEMTEARHELEVVFFFEGDLARLERTLGSLGNCLVIARATEDSGSVHIHSTRAGEVIEAAFAGGAVSGLRLEVLPEPAAAPATAARRVFAVAPAGPVADLFTAAGALVVDPADSGIGGTPADVFLPNGSRVDAGEARVVPTDSLVAGIAAVSVYDPSEPDTDAVVSTMRDAARSMRVARPQSQTTDALIVAARGLLAEGGEQVTILAPHAVDAEALTAKLGVDVMALSVPGVDAEVGVE